MKIKVFLGLIASLAAFVAAGSGQASVKPPCGGHDWCVTSPAAGKTVLIDKHRTLTVNGLIVRKHQGTTLMLLTRAPGAGRVYVSDSVAMDSSGSWSRQLKKIGAKDDPIGSRYYIMVLPVSDRCADAMWHSSRGYTGAVRFTDLPKGCSPSVLAGEVTIQLRKVA